jgi:hypothetical protein
MNSPSWYNSTSQILSHAIKNIQIPDEKLLVKQYVKIFQQVSECAPGGHWDLPVL